MTTSSHRRSRSKHPSWGRGKGVGHGEGGRPLLPRIFAGHKRGSNCPAGPPEGCRGSRIFLSLFSLQRAFFLLKEPFFSFSDSYWSSRVCGRGRQILSPGCTGTRRLNILSTCWGSDEGIRGCWLRRRIHVSYDEEDTCVRIRGCWLRRRIHVSYEEEDTCVNCIFLEAINRLTFCLSYRSIINTRCCTQEIDVSFDTVVGLF